MKKLLRKIIVYANLVFAVFLIFSFLSRYISPATIWLPAFLGLAYPYILAANFIFLGFWLSRKKKEFLISFLAILLGWHTLTGYISLHPTHLFKKRQFETLERPDRVKNGQLKVMSFNVRTFDRYNWADNPSTRADLLQLISEEDPDILCIQEFYNMRRGPFLDRDIAEAMQNAPHRHLEYSLRGGAGKYGVATFSSNPIVDKGSIQFENTINLSIYTDILVGEDTIRVYNNHLQSIHFDRANYGFLDSLGLRYNNEQLEGLIDISDRLRDAFIKRSEQAAIIAAHIEKCPYPVLVCGDFNDTPVSYTYYRLSNEMEDAFTSAGWGTGRTYIGKFPSFRIDYILHSRSFETLYFARKKVRFSDHFPIIAYLKRI